MGKRVKRNFALESFRNITNVTWSYSRSKKVLFSIDINKFRKKLPQLRDFFKSWNPRLKDEKDKFITHFSIDSWEQLSLARKKEHRFANCPGCKKRDLEVQALFPVRSKQFQSKAKENAFFKIKNTQIKSAPKIPRPLSKFKSRRLPRAYMTTFNSAFEKICNVPVRHSYFKDF